MKLLTLEEYFDYKKNSLTFFRIILASLVLVGHSYELSGVGHDPLDTLIGRTLGSIAVNGFFAISGFLITMSFINTRSKVGFFWNRFLRIFPGFWVCLIITGGMLAPTIFYFKHGNLSNFQGIFKNPYISYIAKNFFLKINMMGIEGVFENNVAFRVINGSLWTLFPEFLCYTTVAVLGFIGFLKQRFKYIVVVLLLFIVAIHSSSDILLDMVRDTPYYGKVWYLLQLSRLFAYFFGGIVLFLFKEKIKVNQFYLLILTFIYLLSLSLRLDQFIGAIILPYVLFGLSILIPVYNLERKGDPSYGIYIYSYPVQQTLYFFFGAINPYLFFLLTSIITVPISLGSWFFIEKPSLRLKKIFKKT